MSLLLLHQLPVRALRVGLIQALGRSRNSDEIMDESNDSPMRQDIEAAIAARGKRATALRISITAEGEWFVPASETESYWVKWVRWRLLSKNGHNVTRPVFCVVHGDLSQETLLRSAQIWFPGLTCAVDNDIQLN